MLLAGSIFFEDTPVVCQGIYLLLFTMLEKSGILYSLSATPGNLSNIKYLFILVIFYIINFYIMVTIFN